MHTHTSAWICEGRVCTLCACVLGLSWLHLQPCVQILCCCFSDPLVKGGLGGCCTLEQYQNLQGDTGIGGDCKDRESNKRRDDTWGGLGMMNTKFILFSAKRLSSCWGHEGEEYVLISQLGWASLC